MALEWGPRCPIECDPRPRSYAFGSGACGARAGADAFGWCATNGCAMNRGPSSQGIRRARVCVGTIDRLASTSERGPVCLL